MKDSHAVTDLAGTFVPLVGDDSTGALHFAYHFQEFVVLRGNDNPGEVASNRYPPKVRQPDHRASP